MLDLVANSLFEAGGELERTTWTGAGLLDAGRGGLELVEGDLRLEKLKDDFDLRRFGCVPAASDGVGGAVGVAGERMRDI